VNFIRKNLPNAMTLGNLFCGCMALLHAFQGELAIASAFVLVALILDFFDGFTARLLKVSSPIGKDLDSLADMVTFGVLPGFFMYYLLQQSLVSYPAYPANLALAAFSITLFSCIRLARFNNDARQSDQFIGVPTPANTMLICSLGYLYETNANGVAFIMQPWVLLVITVLASGLLIAELPLIALKFKRFGWKGNEFRFVLLGISLILLVVWQVSAFPLVIVVYILLSIVNNIFSKKAV
jgi:CDP-diacylglycerol--serine O-phosphatidyltransferase